MACSQRQNIGVQVEDCLGRRDSHHRVFVLAVNCACNALSPDLYLLVFCHPVLHLNMSPLQVDP